MQFRNHVQQQKVQTLAGHWTIWPQQRLPKVWFSYFGQRSSLPPVCQVDCPVAGQNYYTFTSVLRMIVKLAYIYDWPQLMLLA